MEGGGGGLRRAYCFSDETGGEGGGLGDKGLGDKGLGDKGLGGRMMDRQGGWGGVWGCLEGPTAAWEEFLHVETLLTIRCTTGTTGTMGSSTDTTGTTGTPGSILRALRHYGHYTTGASAVRYCLTAPPPPPLPLAPLCLQHCGGPSPGRWHRGALAGAAEPGGSGGTDSWCRAPSTLPSSPPAAGLLQAFCCRLRAPWGNWCCGAR